MRVVGIMVVLLVLVDVGILMKDLVVVCVVGKIDGEIVFDFNKEEDNYGEVDVLVVIMLFKNDIIFF